MSSYRRRLAAIANKLICGVNVSEQPDNELWYITTDGQKADSSERNLIGGYGKQEGLQVVSHTYENGIGKVRYNADILKFGEGFFNDGKDVIVVSIPRKVVRVSSFSLGEGSPIDNLVLLSSGETELQTNFRPKVKGNVYVQPNCTQYYKAFNFNIIEKKI